MKYVKILGLAAVAAMALMAFVAGSASATTLKHGTETVTSIEATLAESAKLTETTGVTLDTCTESTVAGKTTEDSAPELRGSGTVSWGGCITTTDTVKSGEVGITWIEGTENGTVKSYGAEVTVSLAGISCVYGTPAGGLELGTLKGNGSGNATIEINKEVEFKSGGFTCPRSTVWHAKYKVTNPGTLTVVN